MVVHETELYLLPFFSVDVQESGYFKEVVLHDVLHAYSSSWLTLKSIPWNMMYTQHSSASILSTEFYTKMGLIFYKESHLMVRYLHRHYILLSGPLLYLLLCVC